MHDAKYEKLTRENAYLRGLVQASMRDLAVAGPDSAEGAFFPATQPQRTFPQAAFGAGEARLVFNGLRDTRHAHSDPGLGQVLHIFCQPWMGIRAAAGSLPGHKLAIIGVGELTRAECAQILLYLDREKITRIVLHGMFESAEQLVRLFAKAGLSDRLYLVFHGNAAQWVILVERALALSAIRHAQKGRIRRIHFLQAGFVIPEAQTFLPVLLNPAPRHDALPSAGACREDMVFLPGSDSWRKNLHVNAYGAALSPRVASVAHYAPDIRLPDPLQRKLTLASYSDREATFVTMARVAAVLNVSIVECHPMVGLESESVGTPCLRGLLNLDYGEDHAYVRLVQVDNPLSPAAVCATLERVLSVPLAERRGLIADYTRMMNSMALSRYREFLEL
jgi:hypothetical protein